MSFARNTNIIKTFIKQPAEQGRYLNDGRFLNTNTVYFENIIISTILCMSFSVYYSIIDIHLITKKLLPFIFHSAVFHG